MINIQQQTARYERIINRQNKNINEFHEIYIENNELHTDQNVISVSIKNIGTQVSFDSYEENFVFYCVFDGQNVGAQASNNLNLNFTKPDNADKSCGVDSLNTSSCLSIFSWI